MEYRRSPCCDVLSILVPLQLHKDDGTKVRFGNTGVCPGKSYDPTDHSRPKRCYRVTRKPTLWLSLTPQGYGELWPFLKTLDGAKRWAFDVEITDKTLCPLGMTPAETRAALGKLNLADKQDYRDYDEPEF